ncbi:hypothetical protein Hanom_Chr01g00082251 [Helianthus anomalus]
MKMTTKFKRQGFILKKFEFWTKVAKVTKPQRPFWQFTLTKKISVHLSSYILIIRPFIRRACFPRRIRQGRGDKNDSIKTMCGQ